jgi:23S rRNA (guanosine2251-2'-O)-methyltransferase
MLDGISDPQNYGAILRTALASSVTAVIVRERRQAPLNETVIKSSAGAAARIPIFETTNLSQTIDKLTKQGYWSVAACQDPKAVEYSKFEWATPMILIMGAEGEGVSELLLKNSDHKITIPISPKMESLNVSVAAGILLFSALEKRGIRFPKS